MYQSEQPANLHMNMRFFIFPAKRHITVMLIIIICKAVLIYNVHAQNELIPKRNIHAVDQPPEYADTGRLTKIKAALPVIEKMYKNYAAANHFPGSAFGVVADGKLICSGGNGFADVDQQLSVTPTSLFRIASMTKSFTAMAVLQLRDEGKLRLDDSISTYIPQTKRFTYLTDDAPPITIRHLLTHSAGFPEDNPWGDRQLQNSNEELMQLIEQGVSFSNAPGISYEYSNLGFTLLGYIVSKVSGKPYQQYITEKILRPLGMNHTLWEYTLVPYKQLAHGYRRLNGQWKEELLLHDGAYGAMGGLISSIEDFSKYMNLFLSSWPLQNNTDESIIKRSSIREMQQLWRFNTLIADYRYPNGKACPLVTGYGYGLRWSKDCDGRITIGHSGGLPGFGSNWVILPDYGIGLVSLSNLTYGAAGLINTRVMDTLIALAALKPRQITPSPILKQKTSELIKVLSDWKNAQSSGIFAENFFADNSSDFWQKQTREIFIKLGKIIHINPIIPENQLRGSFVMEGENGDIEVYFTLTPEKPALIQELKIRETAKQQSGIK